MSTNQYNVAVIGCGVIGAMTAEGIAAKGLSCAVIEEKKAFHPLTGSFAATRAGHTLYDEGLYRDYARQSLALYEQSYPGCFEKTGALLLDDAESDSFAKKVFEGDREHFDWLHRAALQKNYADLHPRAACTDTRGGLFLCRKITAHLKKKLRQKRVNIYQGAKIVAANKNGGDSFTLSLSDGREIQAQKIIIAAGMGSESIIRLLMPGHASVKFLSPKAPRILHYKFKGSPLKVPAFAVIETGFFHLPPSCLDAEGHGKIGVFTNSFTLSEAEDLVAMADRYIKDFSLRTSLVETHFDKGVYDTTTDGHFVVGPSAQDSNILLGCGMNGMGYKFAPLIAKLLGTKACDETTDIPAEWLPARFGI